MKDLSGMYHPSMPAFLKELCASPEMMRIQNVGMNCGCEYTQFPLFRNLEPYSRYQHSVGTALITWHFTGEEKQAVAALFHDIATPVFAHVVDFLHGDYLTQESTEDGTRERIRQCPVIQQVLRRLCLTTEDVCDYHRYPVADNPSPQLSADRLEYTLGNLVNFSLETEENVREYYEDIVVGEDEKGMPELVFQHQELAERFALSAMRSFEVYVSDPDRYAMQRLSELLGEALEKHVLTEQDVYTTEDAVIRKLEHSGLCEAWHAYCAMSRVEVSDTDRGGLWRKIPAKRRYIDPMVPGKGRVSAWSPAFQAIRDRFVSRSQAYYVLGCP